MTRLGAASVARYGRRLMRGDSANALFLRTPAAFKALRALALECLSDENWAATVQIQSLFDASRPGTPHLVFTDHTHLSNLDYEYFELGSLATPAWIVLERTVYDHATAVAVRSTNVARSLVDRYGVDPAKVHVVYAGANAPADPIGPAEPWDPWRIVFVGVDWERKGGPALVSAFEQLRTTDNRATLVVIGSTPTLPKGATALGRVSPTEVAQQLRRGGIFCLPTRVEPFGVAFVEALATGLPIVATNVGAVPDMVRPGHNGALVPVGSVDALVAALGPLLGDEVEQRRLGVAGAALAADRYTWLRVGERVRQILEPAIVS